MVNTGDMSVNPGNTSTLIYKYMRPEHLPHIWCPGCGNGHSKEESMCGSYQGK